MGAKKAVIAGALLMVSSIPAHADANYDEIEAARLRWCHAHGAVFKSELPPCQADLDKWRNNDLSGYCVGIGLKGDSLDTCVEDMAE